MSRLVARFPWLAPLALVLGFTLGVVVIGTSLAPPPAQAQVSTNVRSVASIISLAAPGANTDILAADFSPSTRCAWRVTVSLGTASVFNVVAESGATAYTIDLNGGVALTASTMYTFTFSAAPPGQATVGGVLTACTIDYNFRVETDGVIQYLMVEEVYGNEL